MQQNHDDLCTNSRDPLRSNPDFHGLSKTPFPNLLFIRTNTLIIKNKN